MKGSDLHAADAVYHVACYVSMGNNYRSLVRKQNHSNSKANHEKAKLKAIDAAVDCINQQRDACNRSIFELNELYNIFLKNITDSEGHSEEQTCSGSTLPGMSCARENIEELHDDTDVFGVPLAKQSVKDKYNRTRFKEQLMSKLPKLVESVTKHRKVLLAFEEDIAESLHSTSMSEKD